MDVRHTFTSFDQQFLGWCQALSLSLHVLLTKADKVSRSQAKATLLAARQRLRTEDFEAGVQLFSALDRSGVDELRARVLSWLDVS